MKTVTVIINNAALAQTLGKKAGDRVKVEVNNGVPVRREWRNRFKDCKIDGCITIVTDEKVPQSKPKTEEISK